MACQTSMKFKVQLHYTLMSCFMMDVYAFKQLHIFQKVGSTTLDMPLNPMVHLKYTLFRMVVLYQGRSGTARNGGPADLWQGTARKGLGTARALGPGAHEPMGPWAHGPKGPCAHGPNVPRSHGPMGPWAHWAHGPMCPCASGPLGP